MGRKSRTDDCLEAIDYEEFFKLHVFGSNAPAIHLYHHLGFEIAGINMYKVISK